MFLIVCLAETSTEKDLIWGDFDNKVTVVPTNPQAAAMSQIHQYVEEPYGFYCKFDCKLCGVVCTDTGNKLRLSFSIHLYVRLVWVKHKERRIVTDKAITLSTTPTVSDLHLKGSTDNTARIYNSNSALDINFAGVIRKVYGSVAPHRYLGEKVMFACSETSERKYWYCQLSRIWYLKGSTDIQIEYIVDICTC